MTILWWYLFSKDTVLQQWSQTVDDPITTQLHAIFDQIHATSPNSHPLFDSGRNILRHYLFSLHPTVFPLHGHQKAPALEAVTLCTGNPMLRWRTSTGTEGASFPSLKDYAVSASTILDVQTCIDSLLQCDSGTDKYHLTHGPPLLLVESPPHVSGKIIPNATLAFPTLASLPLFYCLRALIYLGHDHFTSRLVFPGSHWAYQYDGMLESGTPSLEHIDSAPAMLSLQGSQAIGYIYGVSGAKLRAELMI